LVGRVFVRSFCAFVWVNRMYRLKKGRETSLRVVVVVVVVVVVQSFSRSVARE
jgi:hypothetical protein